MSPLKTHRPSRMMSCRTVLLVSTIVASPLLLTLASSAQAATATSHAKPAAHKKSQARAPLNSGSETVQVAARRGVTSAGQHNAHSETILSRQELQNRNVRQLTDIVRVAPNLTIQPSFGSAALNFALRGVG
ncbi:Plug domain-containing protein [Asaia platycodi]|uniref:Plug domain-containing protein n=1 Tax=Asaia platycodi TaxID=610243 RepID=UPI0006878C5F|nr:Plug domain-containing protein [Asaia platycodi]